MGIQGDMEGGSCGGYIQDIMTLVENFEMVSFKSEQIFFFTVFLLDFLIL